MVNKRLIQVFFAGFLSGILTFGITAQGELAATLEVLSPSVEVLRVNTTNPIEVSVEAIVGVGDIIRTDEAGRARITFFADGTETELLPNTEYTIERFEGNEGSFTLSVSVLAGQTQQRINNLLDADSEYSVNTPGMTLAARGTAFDIRVEENGRSAMLVSEGNVDAAKDTEDSANVESGFGIRAEAGGTLSDVVRATSFENLDSALDGCDVSINFDGDIRLNVRTGPSLERPRVGTVAPAETALFVGVSESGQWYRINFQGGFGWIFAEEVQIAEACAGLRQFPDAHTEDVTLYEALGDTIDPDDLELPEITPEPAGGDN